jgi:hypothetical protein
MWVGPLLCVSPTLDKSLPTLFANNDNPVYYDITIPTLGTTLLRTFFEGSRIAADLRGHLF